MLIEFTGFAKEADLGPPVEDAGDYADEINGWPQSVYYAWVMYGAISFQASVYWI